LTENIIILCLKLDKVGWVYAWFVEGG